MAAEPIRVGVDEEGEPVYWDPLAHSLAFGATGAGKSALMQTALWSAAVRDRGSVLIAGCDPSGLLLGPFGSEWVAVGSDPSAFVEFPDRCIEVLERVVAEMNRRVAQLASERITKFSRDWYDSDLPYIVVVMEEFFALKHMVEAVDKRKWTRIHQLIILISVYGRKTGTLVFISSQEARKDFLDIIRAQIGNAYVLQMDKREDVANVFANVDSTMVSRLSRALPGQGFARTIDRRSETRFFRALLADEDRYYTAVEAVYELPVGVRAGA